MFLDHHLDNLALPFATQAGADTEVQPFRSDGRATVKCTSDLIGKPAEGLRL